MCSRPAEASPSPAQRRGPSFPAPRGQGTGQGLARRGVSTRSEGARVPSGPSSSGRVSGRLARRQGGGGRCRRRRAGPERGDARREASAGAAGAGRGGLGAWRATPRRAGRSGGGRAASARAGGEAAAARRREELGAAPRAPLLHGAAPAARAAPRRAPQGAQPAGDGGALPGLGDHPGLHQPPPEAASQGERRAAGPGWRQTRCPATLRRGSRGRGRGC